MDIEWDPRKAAENLRKHGVDFADAVVVLEDENALTIEDIEGIDHDEQRFKSLGMGPSVNILYVIHTYREDDRVRIISARKADRSEAKQYYRGLDYE
ncbi:MAG: BrnT family toxin [Ectothiorhodospiraceae bacterium]|nr:BrnT family toxin [Ectothiorhodospiraceae bacterium]